MYRAFGSAAAVATCATTCAFFVACAVSSPADLSPDLDPSLPGVDAGHDPQAVPGAQNGDDAGGSDGAAPGDSGGQKTIAPDSGGGVDAAPPIPKPAAGEVIISEVMYATLTPEPSTEWIELYSAATGTRSLSGLTIKDGASRTHVIAAGVTIAGGSYVLLARNKAAAVTAKVPMSAIAYEYGTGLADNAGVLLANGATGAVSLLDGATVITSSPYGGWFSQSGRSIQLVMLDPTTSTAKAGWCLSLNAWSTGSDKGTPGAAGDCP